MLDIEIDEAVVESMVAGISTAPQISEDLQRARRELIAANPLALTPTQNAERREAVRRLRVAGRTYKQIAEQLNVHHRQVARDVAWLKGHEHADS